MAIKIAFQALGGNQWYAGISHPKSLFHALKETYGNEVRLCLLAQDNNRPELDNLERDIDETLLIPTNNLWQRPSFVKRVTDKFFPRKRCFLKQHKIDVVFGIFLPRYEDIPTLSWIPDVNIPSTCYSDKERLWLHQQVLDTAKVSTRVICMSEVVKRDFQSFSPMHAHKARVLQTSSFIPESIYETNPKFIADSYHLPDKFIYLPNQFWVKKNHEIAFQAVKKLKDRGIKVFLVCSGYPADNWWPMHFSELLQKVSNWDIRNQIAFLGLIPRDHIFQLIRQSVCVLNPSLFEGFGLTVDEARNIGKQLLLSDIPIFREQDPPAATFFNPYDCESFSNDLELIWLESSPGPDMELEREARENLPGRMRESAESFMSVLREVAG